MTPPRVLLLIDTSRRSGAALARVVELCESSGTQSVTLLYLPRSLGLVYNSVAASPVGPAELAEVERESLIRRARTQLPPRVLIGPLIVGQISIKSLEAQITKRDYDLVICGIGWWRRLTSFTLLRILRRSRLTRIEILAPAPTARR